MVKLFKLGKLKTNIYVWWNEETLEGFVVDPAIDSDEVKSFILDKGLKIKYILLTHGHFDHVCGVVEMKKYTLAKVAMHPADIGIMKTYNKMGRLFGYQAEFFEPHVELRDGQEIKIGDKTIKVIVTPGHSKGGVCFYLSEEKILFSGDTLFYNIHGRTDLPESSQAEMGESLIKLLTSLPDDTQVLPGHGTETTIQTEKEFFKSLL